LPLASSGRLFLSASHWRSPVSWPSSSCMYGSKEAAVRSTDEHKRKLHQLILTPPSALTSSQMQSCFLVPGTVVQTDAGASRGRSVVTRAMEPRPMAGGTLRCGACPDGPRSARAVDLAPTAGGARVTELGRPAGGGAG
jgi:hypothetical protein